MWKRERIGANLIWDCICFSRDSKFVFVGIDNNIKIINVLTSLTVTTMSLPEKIKSTGLILNPKNDLQLVSSSTDGYIRVWDWEEGELLWEFSVSQYPINGICSVDLKPNWIVYYSFGGDGNWNVNAFILKDETSEDLLSDVDSESGDEEKSINGTGKGKAKKKQKSSSAKPQEQFELLHLFAIDKKPHSLVAQCSEVDGHRALGKFLVAMSKRKLYVFDVEAMKISNTYDGERSFSCCTPHPKQTNILAVGDLGGRISFYDILKDGGVSWKVCVAQFHWHPHECTSLSFSENGAYLLSGGHEGVLVIWQMETGHKNFIPRFQTSILSITSSLDSTGSVISCADNALYYLHSATSKVKSIFQGLYCGQHPSARILITSEPQTDYLVLEGAPGHLQLYNMGNSQILGNLEISRNPPVSAATDNSLPLSHVESCCFSFNGDWMFTVDRRVHLYGDTKDIVELKFWKYNTLRKGVTDGWNWTLNTRVDQPHGFFPVTDIAVHPTKHAIVTCSVDKTFKLWNYDKRDGGSEAGEKYGWSCVWASSYKDKKMRSCAFSRDGSCLAVACDELISLWKPSTAELITSLAVPNLSERIHRIRFCGGSRSSELIALSKQNLRVWNLITKQVLYCLSISDVSFPYSLTYGPISVDPNSDLFAVSVYEDKFSVKYQNRLLSNQKSKDKEAQASRKKQKTNKESSNIEVSPSCVLLGSSASAKPLAVFGLTSPATSLYLVPSTRIDESPSIIISQLHDGIFSIRKQSEATLTTTPPTIVANEASKEKTAPLLGFAQLFANSSPLNSPVFKSSNVLWDSSSLSSLFSGQGHMLPPVSRLFDSMMTNALPSREPAADKELPEKSSTILIGSEDIEMIEAPVESTVVNGGTPSDLLDAELDERIFKEVDDISRNKILKSMTQFFKEQKFDSTAPPSTKNSSAKGTRKKTKK